MQSDVPEHQAGAAIVGRLRGPAFQFSMRLTQESLNMATGVRQVFAAPELFAEPAHADWTDPATGVVHAAELGGV